MGDKTQRMTLSGRVLHDDSVIYVTGHVLILTTKSEGDKLFIFDKYHSFYENKFDEQLIVECEKGITTYSVRLVGIDIEGSEIYFTITNKDSRPLDDAKLLRVSDYERMEARIATLEAALTEAHRVILHELDSGRTPYMLKAENGGKGLGYFEDVLTGINRS